MYMRYICTLTFFSLPPPTGSFFSTTLFHMPILSGSMASSGLSRLCSTGSYCRYIGYFSCRDVFKDLSSLLQNAVLFFFHWFEVTEHQAQPIEIEIQHRAGQQRRILIHEQQQQEPQGPQWQELPAEAHPLVQTSFVEDSDQSRRAGTESYQHRDYCQTFSVREVPSSLSRQQPDSQVPLPTRSTVAPGSPVEETLSEDGRSALFITSSNISPQLKEASENHATAVRDIHETMPPTLGDVKLLACPEKDGLRGRQLMHLKKQGHDLSTL